MKTFFSFRMLLAAILIGTLTATSFAQSFPNSGNLYSTRLRIQADLDAGTGWSRGWITNNLYFNLSDDKWKTVASSYNDFAMMKFSNGGHIDFYARTSGGANTITNGQLNNFHRMRISRDGKVGIGTNDPSYPLHLATSGTNWATIGLDAPGTNGNKWLLRSRADNKEFDIRSAETGINVVTLKPDGDMHVSGDVYANGIKLGTSGSGFDADNVPTIKVYATSGDDVIRMRRASLPDQEFVFKYGWDGRGVLVKRNWSGGNVSSEPVIMRFGEVTGIPNVNTKVEFPNGKIYCTEIEVNVAGQGDFVFEDDYDLKDLKEVESFIEANGHLPEIPKAPEAGLAKWDVGEMSNKLLIKIEELTLYTIEQQKEIAAKDKQYKELLERLENIEKELNE